MALKKDGERIAKTYTIKKTTAAKLEELAAATNRPVGRMLDEVIERYENDNAESGNE